ncbi:microsomal signal peptidase 25 kDa subunit-domain-containing protein [Podospora didyma]|uniref:Signal peptidase complex subunit 2 n=1 Tax=Podospora didyma TaxID=330526 RepID=A0AAE0KAA5_9PEZI|nr:microsomal signal peptidase 25 kDa subunit-domain-containing protein [Podospora didyma]
MAAAQEKITVYNAADLKNTSDDAIPNYLNSLKFKQSHRLTDVRLAMGYSAFTIAGACFLWDYKLGFESTKWLTAAAVAIYTLLNGALTLWIMMVEKGTVYEGTAPSGETLRITTATKKQAAKGQAPQYHVTVQVTPKGGNGSSKKLEISRPFAEWFDGTGAFVAAPFQSMLASAVPVIGKLDPKRAAAPAEIEGASIASSYTPELLDALAKDFGSNTEAATGVETASAKKGGKRRKA